MSARRSSLEEEESDQEGSSGEGQTNAQRSIARRVRRRQDAQPPRPTTIPPGVSFPWRMTTPIVPLVGNRVEIVERVRSQPWCRMGKRSGPDEGEEDTSYKKTFWKIARPPPQIVVEQVNTQSSDVDYDPPPPEPPLTQQEIDFARQKIKESMPQGIPIEGSSSKFIWRIAESRTDPYKGQTFENIGIKLLVQTSTFMCTENDCFSAYKTLACPSPKCLNHRGPLKSWALDECTDRLNKNELVKYHHLASFSYNSEQDKKEMAMLKLNVGRSKIWRPYKTWREKKGLNVESIQLRPLQYFPMEEEAMKAYSSRQFVVILKKLLEPATTVPVHYVNTKIFLPVTAQREVKDELDFFGIELSIGSRVSDQDRNNILYPWGNEKFTGPPATAARGWLYMLSNHHINYGGKCGDPNFAHYNLQSDRDPVGEYKTHPNSKPFETIILGSCPKTDLLKYESELHICVLLSHLFDLPNAYNSGTPPYYFPRTHPVCLNRTTESIFFDAGSWSRIDAFMQKQYGVKLYLGPRRM